MTKLYIAIFIEKSKTEYQNLEIPLKGRAALIVSAVLLPLLGVFAKPIMQQIAVMMQGFIGSEGPLQSVNYFSIENLKGALISLSIGAVVYFGIVRTLLMRKADDGSKEYVNRLPEWLDVENMLYRPLVERLLPKLLGFIAGVLNSLTDWFVLAVRFILAFAARVLDEGIDSAVLGLWRTVFSERKTHAAVPVGNRFTYALGRVFDVLALAMNKTLCRKHPITVRFEDFFAACQEEISEVFRKVSWSVSFGLLLLCIGLLIAFQYILG